MNEIVNLEGTSLAEQKEYNNKLFNLYGNMVEPLSGIEHLYMVRRNLMSELVQLDKSNIQGKVLAATLVAGLVFTYYFVDIIDNISFIGRLFYSNVGLYLLLVLTLGIGFVVFAAYTIDKKIREKKMAGKKAEMENINKQIQQSTDEIREQLQFIPPSYCYSDAMRYFARAYIDGKVDNVKEAMISYDEYIHRQNMEHGQLVMMQQQGQILANQVAIQQQMSYDTAMIILSNFAFR